MKKITKVISLVVAAGLLASCGNMSVGPGNYEFNGAHICVNGEAADVQIKNWHNNDGAGVEVQTIDGNSLFLSEGTYILFEDECPICNR